MSDDVFETTTSNGSAVLTRRGSSSAMELRENWSVLDLADKMKDALKTTPDVKSVCSLIPYDTRIYIVHCLRDDLDQSDEDEEDTKAALMELENENLLLQAAFKQETDKKVSLQLQINELMAEMEILKSATADSSSLSAISSPQSAPALPPPPPLESESAGLDLPPPPLPPPPPDTIQTLLALSGENELEKKENEKDILIAQISAELEELRLQRHQERKTTETENIATAAAGGESECHRLEEQVLLLNNTVTEQEQKIAELKATVQKYKRVQDMVRSASLSVGRRPSDVSSSAAAAAVASTGLSAMSPTECEGAPSALNSTPLTPPGTKAASVSGATHWQYEVESVGETARKRRASMEEKTSNSFKNDDTIKKKKRFGSFSRKGGKLFKLVRNKSSSEPNLSSGDEVDAKDDFTVSGGKKERQRLGSSGTAEDIESGVSQNQSQQHRSAVSRLKRSASAFKGTLERAIGRLRRHASQTAVHNIDGDDVEYQDSRPGWTVARSFEQQTKLASHPVSKWDSEMVAKWMSEVGLEMYGDRAKHSGFTGSKLIESTESDLDRDLIMYHPLHKKKLKLAFNNLVADVKDNLEKLDHTWVAFWLDGIGLPQYKQAFLEARIDGRVLNVLTLDDLALLRVQNAFHHVCLKRAIQCLRQQNFSPHCLIGANRSDWSDTSLASDPTLQTRNSKPEHVLRWTNGRVCQWLESIEMGEYVGNLKETGVHGAMLILEPRFNADTLAATLQVKELVRRHLSQHFSKLVGPTFLALKREAESSKGFVPLEPLAKKHIRRRMLSLGSLRRRVGVGKTENEGKSAYVCPLDLDMPFIAVTGRPASFKESHLSSSGGRGAVITATDLRTGSLKIQGGRREQRKWAKKEEGSSTTGGQAALTAGSAGPSTPSSSTVLAKNQSGNNTGNGGRTNEIEVMSKEMDSLTDMINKELEKKNAAASFFLESSNISSSS